MVKRPAEPLNPHHPWLSRQLSDTETKRPFYIITAMLYLCDAVDSNNTASIRALANAMSRGLRLQALVNCQTPSGGEGQWGKRLYLPSFSLICSSYSASSLSPMCARP